LTALRVPFNTIGNGGISALFDAASLTSLTELDLSESGSYGRYGEDPIIESTGLQALAAWPGLARVRSLTLSGNDGGRDGLGALLRSPHVTALKELKVRANELNGQDMHEFAGAQPRLRLDVLNLGENLLRDRGATNLAKASCLTELKVLVLDRCEVGLFGARGLAEAPFLGGLRRLKVNHNSFGWQGLQALLEKQPQMLHTLEMVNNDLGDEAVVRLADAPASNTLQEVDLRMNSLTDRAAETLATSQHLQNLCVLQLDPSQISKWAAAALAGSPLGKRLVASPKDDEEDIPF
jgi:Ran GTPase-activating protein (RanGAP) involved in mRNA processing and transport